MFTHTILVAIYVGQRGGARYYALTKCTLSIDYRELDSLVHQISLEVHATATIEPEYRFISSFPILRTIGIADDLIQITFTNRFLDDYFNHLVHSTYYYSTPEFGSQTPSDLKEKRGAVGYMAPKHVGGVDKSSSWNEFTLYGDRITVTVPKSWISVEPSKTDLNKVILPFFTIVEIDRVNMWIRHDSISLILPKEPVSPGFPLNGSIVSVPDVFAYVEKVSLV